MLLSTINPVLMNQISSIQGDQVILIGHRRLRITEMVSGCFYLSALVV